MGVKVGKVACQAYVCSHKLSPKHVEEIGKVIGSQQGNMSSICMSSQDIPRTTTMSIIYGKGDEAIGKVMEIKKTFLIE